MTIRFANPRIGNPHLLHRRTEKHRVQGHPESLLAVGGAGGLSGTSPELVSGLSVDSTAGDPQRRARISD